MDIQKLKEVIVKANPEILELKFGCKIALKDRKTLDFVWVNYGVGHLLGCSGQHWHLDKDVYKILGRPITLADVLWAIEITNTGFLINKIDSIWQKLSWNLKDDNLDNQSPECLEFLYSLLVK